MTIVIVDPNLSLSSPSMKGVIRSLPYLKEQGCTLEGWCWHDDQGLPFDKIVRLPRLGNIHTLGGHAFTFWCSLYAWWHFQVCQQPRPDVLYTVASYLTRCDVAHVHFSNADWERRQKILGLTSLRDLYERVTNYLGLLLARHFYRKTTARLVLSVSESVAQDIKSENARLNIKVLPNCYDPLKFHSGVRELFRTSKREELGFTATDKVFVFASAGHYRRKGFPLVVGALELLRTKHPEARLLILGGTGPRLAGLQKQLARQYPGWEKWITFTGMVPDVERYFAASDAFLFPSYSEAFALVEVEAAACGLPLFLTRHHGSEMILEDGVNGRYLDFDTLKIAEVLAEFITGDWQPQPGTMKHALNSSTYAKRLMEELQRVAAGQHAR